MLSGSAILRISILLVVAGCLAALVQYFLPYVAPAPGVPVQAPEPAVAPRRIETRPAPQPPDPPRAPAATPVPVPSPQPSADVPAPAAPSTPSPAQPAPAERVSQPPSPPTGQAAIDEANDNAGPRALALIDLNGASVAQLNGLRGGGSIGRAIVQKRPYAAIDQLLSKRVLSRATYDKIKDQITVR